MGYETRFGLKITSCPLDTKEEQAVKDEISKKIKNCCTERYKDIEYGFTAKWGSYEEDLKEISKRHPSVLIEIYCNGEDAEDVWKARFRNGESETIQFETLPDFKDILSQEEEEKIFSKARDKYWEALLAMKEAAIRRIRTLKDRITEGPDRHLSLERLNDVCPQLVIACERPCSNREYDPLLVYGIHDDGETLSTEQDPVDIKDLLPDDLHDLVDLLEGIVKEIEKGDIKGRWNDDEEWYELYYATNGEGE